MLRIAIKTDDDRLYQKLLLMLEDRAATTRIINGASGFDIVIYDARWGGDAPLTDSALSIGIGGGQLGYPFTEGELFSAISRGENVNTARLRKIPEERCVMIDGETVALTDVEWRLFDLIERGGGEYVSRAELISGVWGGGCTESSLNVYIHYLREKLERSGERVILSSRRGGYRLDEKFL